MSRAPSPPSPSVGGRPAGSVAAFAWPALRLPPALRPLVVLGADACRRGSSSSLAKSWRPPGLLHCDVGIAGERSTVGERMSGGRETGSVREIKKMARCSDSVLLDSCMLIR
jgi:hypothetical protein